MSRPVIVAVLFADLSGSTRLYDKLGDQRALEIVERCIALFTRVTGERGGRVIKSIGDEILAVFVDVPSAAQASVDMQMGLMDLPEAMQYALSMHAGLHWGEVMVTQGDVFGDTVNVAARLTSVAKRGQIVVSEDVRALLDPSFADQVRRLGTEPVKGKDQPLELYELLWEPDAELTEVAHMKQNATMPVTALAVTYLGNRYEVGVEQPVLAIGRDPASGIVTNDKLASRHHARIEKSMEKYSYTDFSSNGTFVQLAGQEEQFVRRDSVVLRGSGTLSFGRPFQNDPAAAIRFEVASKGRR